jgi:hypothetical protein
VTNNELLDSIESLPPMCNSLPFIFNGNNARIETMVVTYAKCGVEIHASVD